VIQWNYIRFSWDNLKKGLDYFLACLNKINPTLAQDPMKMFIPCKYIIHNDNVKSNHHLMSLEVEFHNSLQLQPLQSYIKFMRFYKTFYKERATKFKIVEEYAKDELEAARILL
jgi:hypothetical protein